MKHKIELIKLVNELVDEHPYFSIHFIVEYVADEYADIGYDELMNMCLHQPTDNDYARSAMVEHQCNYYDDDDSPCQDNYSHVTSGV